MIYCLATSLTKDSIEGYGYFQVVTPNEYFNVGPFSIIAFQAYHGDESSGDAVIYVVNILNMKIIIGWDFLSLPQARKRTLESRSTRLGAQTYNPHPETGNDLGY